MMIAQVQFVKFEQLRIIQINFSETTYIHASLVTLRIFRVMSQQTCENNTLSE